jgi:hypothetical protein
VVKPGVVKRHVSRHFFTKSVLQTPMHLFDSETKQVSSHVETGAVTQFCAH